MTDERNPHEPKRPLVLTTAAADSWKDVTSSVETSSDEVEIRESSDARTSPPDESLSLVVPRIKGLRVLALGEDAAKLSRLAQELNNIGVNAVASKVNSDGYRNALSFQPDVVISELTSPGKSGWGLFQKFRRHPLLRWTPVLLMRWWKETDGKGEVLTASVVERLGEALTPIRVLEERIAAGRSLSDQVELTGVLGVLKVIVAAGLNGTFSLNDSWNVFDAVVENRKIVSSNRRGVDGTEDSGKRAFLQLLMCDTGHWTFRISEAGGRLPKNIDASFGDLVNFAMISASGLFGPDAFADPEAAKRLGIRSQILRDIASTMTGVGHQIIEGIAAGASVDELDTFICSEHDRLDVEDALIALIRCGAVVWDSDLGKSDDDTKVRRIREGVLHVFEMVREEYLRTDREDVAKPKEVSEPTGREPVPSTGGYYQLTELQPEHVAVGSIEGLKLPGSKYPSETKGFDSTPLDLSDRPTPVLSEKDAAWRREFPDGPVDVANVYSSVLPRDSLVPSPRAMEDRGKHQMWLAVLLALVLSALLVATLVVLSMDDHSRKNSETQVER